MRSVTIGKYVNDFTAIAKQACELLKNEIADHEPHKLCLRLLGLLLHILSKFMYLLCFPFLLGVRISSLICDSLLEQSGPIDYFAAFKKPKVSSEPLVCLTDKDVETKSELVARMVECPVCRSQTQLSTLNRHLDACLQKPPADNMPSTSSLTLSTVAKRVSSSPSGIRASKALKGPLDMFIVRKSSKESSVKKEN